MVAYGRSPVSRVPRQPLLIFLAALTARLLYLWQIHDSPFFATLLGDARGYDVWAQRIAAGEWIGHDVFYQAPLYPYFLGTLYTVAGRNLFVVRVVQAIIGAAACVLLGDAASRFFSPRVGLVCGLMLALYAPAIFFDGLLQKTVLDVFLICAMLSIIARMMAPLKRGPTEGVRSVRLQPDLFVLGLTMGALALTRENAMVLIAVALVWIVLSARDRARHAALFAGGLALVLLPVAARNSAVGGGFYLTTSQFGPNFYMGNNAQTDGTAAPLRSGRGSSDYERQDATEIAERASGRQLTPAEVSDFWTGRALTFIRDQPGAWMRLMLRKTALLWNRTEWLDTESQESYAEYSSLVRLGAVIGNFGVLVPIAALGVLLTWPERRRLWILHAMAAAYAASVVLFYIYARYRFPLVPFLLLFAAAALAQLPQFLRTAKPAQHGAAIALVVAAAIFANWPLLPTDLMKAITENNLGAALADDGRIDAALPHYERAVRIRGDYSPAHNNLGVALAAHGDVDKAIAAYERAVALQPNYPDPEYNIGNALMRQGRPADAIVHFQRALTLDPGLPDVHNNLAMALTVEGRLDEAIAEYREAVRVDPGSAKVHRNLANALADKGALPEAIDQMRQAAALAPADGSIRYDLGSLLLDGEQYDAAIAELREAARMTPDSFEAHNNLGIALASSSHASRFDEAIAEFERALKIRPNDESALKNLAMARQARAAKPQG